jgi:hypothetical protein
MEQLARSQLDYPAISEGSGGRAREDQTDVFDGAAGRTHTWAYMGRPTPAGFVGRAADREAADVHQFEPTLGHLSDFVGRFKSLEDDVYHGTSDLQFMCVRLTKC